MKDERLVIKFTPDQKDYVRASRALASKSPGFLLIVVVTVLAMIASVVIILFPSIADASLRNIAIIVLVVGVFYIIYYLVVIPMQISRTFKSNEDLQKERQLTFTDSGVTMQIDDQALKMDWAKIRNVVDRKGFFLLVYVADERIYPFIPGRAFESGDSEARFRDLLKEKNISVK